MIATVLSALAKPTPLHAMRLLADGSDHGVCNRMRRLGATPSRMSRHMQGLTQAGLGVDRRDAQWVRHRITPDLSLPLARLVADALKLELDRKEGPV